ncbi:MAG: biliverdin-producing heme oxygenase [Rubrivivax sp.]|nr:biliverdin-producing heme oxygenase [Rubrivivax sp.]
MPLAPALSVDVLDRLKAQTRAEHLAMEDALGLMRDDLLLADYRRLLERYFGFYAPVEARLAGLLPSDPLGGLDFETRRKLPLLRADLAALGGPAADTLAVCHALPPLRTPAQAMGCLYVLEGATLGGVVISRHVQRTLGLTPDSGARYFHGNGAHTAEMWRAFRSALAGFSASAANADAVVESANETFRSLRHWYVRGRAA